MHDHSFASLLRGHVPEPAVPVHRAVERRARTIRGRCTPACTRRRRSSTSCSRRSALPHLPHRRPDAARSGASSTTQYIRPLDDYFETPRPARCPTSWSCTPGFRGDLRTDDHSQGDVRLGQRVHPRGVRRVRGVAAVGARAVRPHLRRVGWLLRPREAADPGRRPRHARPRTTASAWPASGCPPSSRRPTPGPATSTTGSTTTRRSCASSSGASSARPPEGPGGADDTWYLTLRDRNANNVGAVAGCHPSRSGARLRPRRRDRCRYSPRPADEARSPRRRCPRGEHPDPFVVAEELEDAARARSTRLAAHRPGSTPPGVV